MNEQRDAAKQSLLEAQRNPVLSSEQSFRSAHVHALLAIEETLGELLMLLRAHTRLQPTS